MSRAEGTVNSVSQFSIHHGSKSTTGYVHFYRQMVLALNHSESNDKLLNIKLPCESQSAIRCRGTPETCAGDSHAKLLPAHPCVLCCIITWLHTSTPQMCSSSASHAPCWVLGLEMGKKALQHNHLLCYQAVFRSGLWMLGANDLMWIPPMVSFQ